MLNLIMRRYEQQTRFARIFIPHTVGKKHVSDYRGGTTAPIPFVSDKGQVA